MQRQIMQRQIRIDNTVLTEAQISAAIENILTEIDYPEINSNALAGVEHLGDEETLMRRFFRSLGANDIMNTINVTMDQFINAVRDIIEVNFIRPLPNETQRQRITLNLNQFLRNLRRLNPTVNRNRQHRPR